MERCLLPGIDVFATGDRHDAVDAHQGRNPQLRLQIGNERCHATDKVTCPACGRSMTLLYTIRRAFAENLNVFKCRCGLTLAKPESKTTPPRAAA